MACSLSLTLLMTSATAQDYRTVRHTDAAGYSYEEVTGDPTHTRVYRLPNGLTVYLSRNASKPRIQTYIPVRTGSNNDPKDYTGLAHYLEHMLFKGTSRLGSMDWERERVELEKIRDLYEAHKAETDEARRTAIYRQIDSISQVAASYVSPNEYDRLTTSIGAQGTNAHTWVEETVYKNDIPANELERWLQIESERFDELVLRLFHTEMEAVYEEYNMNQDRISRRLSTLLNSALFPTHPLGQQTTIGTSEHLKSPSLVAIHRYFDQYYTPSNYAIVLVGDLDFDRTIALVDQYFGKKASHEVVQPTFAIEPEMTKTVRHELVSTDPEMLYLAYRRHGGAGTDDEIYTTLIDALLTNGKAGLIDLNLNQAQRVMQAGSYPLHHNEYNVHTFYAVPRQGQTLEEAEALVLEQIDRIKRGDFPDWLLEAVINDMELEQLRGYVEADAVAQKLYSLYIHGQSIEGYLGMLQRMRTVTKADVMAYAQRHYGEGYVVVYKRQGPNADLVRVQNPGITPLQLNMNALSPFAKNLLAQESPRLSPAWVDYSKAIRRERAGKHTIEYIVNEDNDLFELNYIFELGTRADRRMAFALDYLQYLGTDDMTPEEVKQEFYKLGVSYRVTTNADRSYITLSGLKRNMTAGVALLEHLLSHVKGDADALTSLREMIYKERHDAKLNKDRIFRELRTYASYGESNPSRDALSRAEIDAFTPEQLADLIKTLPTYQHRIFYYGNDLKTLSKALRKYHRPGVKPVPASKVYDKVATGHKIYYVDYDMVQTQLMMVRRGEVFDAKEAAVSALFNEYFGGGMSSVVFQEIREAKSLGYSAYAFYGGAQRTGDYKSVEAFVGTQANKLPEALSAMRALLSEMPLKPLSFEAAKESALKGIEAERITREDIFWRYEQLKRLGITEDNRPEVYRQLQALTLDDLKAYFERVIKGDDYTYILIGRESDLPLDLMRQYGEVVKLDVNYLFGNEE